MPTILVRGKYVLVRADLQGRSQVLTEGAVAVQDGTILQAGPYNGLRSLYPEAAVVGNGRQFLLPGLVNAHHHGRGVTYLQLGQPDGPLETWLLRGWGRRPLDPYLMALYTLMRQVRSGTTTVMYNQSAVPADRVQPEAEATLKAFRETGVRVAFSIGFRNQCLLVYGDDAAFLASLPPDLARGARGVVGESQVSLDDYLALTRRLARTHQAAHGDSVRVLLSPASYHWCDEATLQRIGEVARAEGMGIHTHLLESLYQRLYAERVRGQTPVRRLDELGLLGPHVSLAHAVWSTEEDIALLAESGTGVCHNPSSNLRLRSGVAPVLAMLRRGVTVALGTDSGSINDDDDMLQEMALALYLHRPPGLEEQPLTAHQVLHMATLGGARATMFDGLVGSLEPGRQADMVLVDWDAIAEPYLDEEVDPLEALVTRARGRHVQTVIIGGRIVYEDGAFPGLDEKGVRREIAAQLSGPVPDRVRERRRLAQGLEPYLRSFYADQGLSVAPYYSYHSRQ